MSNAAAHLDAIQVRTQVAGAVQVINKSCPRTETLSIEQCNSSFPGAPSETHSRWSSTSDQKEWPKCRKMLPYATAHSEVFQVSNKVAGAVQVLDMSCQSAEKKHPTNAAAHVEVFQVKDRVAGSVQVLQMSCQSAARCSPEQCNCSL